MHARTHAHTSTHVHTHTRTHAQAHVRMHARTSARTRACIHTHECVHTHMRALYALMNVCSVCAHERCAGLFTKDHWTTAVTAADFQEFMAWLSFLIFAFGVVSGCASLTFLRYASLSCVCMCARRQRAYTLSGGCAHSRRKFLAETRTPIFAAHSQTGSSSRIVASLWEWL